MNNKWFQISSVCSPFIAGLALALSQLPPISDWLPNRDLTIRHGSSVVIRGELGIVGYDLLVDLQNTGNTTINVEQVKLIITSPDGAETIYPATHFFDEGSDRTYPIRQLNLEKGSRIATLMIFEKKIRPDLEEKINDVKVGVSQSTFHNRQNSPAEILTDSKWVAADSTYIEKANKLFEENFDLKKGNYHLRLEVFSESSKIPFKIKSHSTVYDFHLRTISSQVEEYRYGLGINAHMLSEKYISLDLESTKD